ncbi:Palmitoyltransferase [Mycena sanguinolenta]|uniref:Palmitoyltransferase n=1 Tax=Mycena sanguinolenta TaxID=230812 RepID=A0A8H6ZCD9_9AGAR|nr:Palmitoyltransferase [Mycena sanguinolenta]
MGDALSVVSRASSTRLAIPTLVFGAVFGTLAALPWYTYMGVLLAGAESFGMQDVRVSSILWFILRNPTPRPRAPALRLYVGLCSYNFFRAVPLDPGTCPRPGSDAKLKSVSGLLSYFLGRRTNAGAENVETTRSLGYAQEGIIEDLAAKGRLNGQTFCVQCPQTSVLETLPTLQLSWTSVLLASQLWQIARQMTLDSGGVEFGAVWVMWLYAQGGRGGTSLNGQMGHRHAHAHGHGHGAAASTDSEPDPLASGTPAHTHTSSGFLMDLLGFDRFTRGSAASGLARASKASNPFDLGIMMVWNFWTKERELGVEYERLYDVCWRGSRRRGSGGSGRKR